MKGLLIVLSCFYLISCSSFEAKREELLNDIYSFYETKTNIFSDTVKKYVESTTITPKIYINTVNINDINYVLTVPQDIRQDLKMLRYQSKGVSRIITNTYTQVNQKSYHAIQEGQIAFYVYFDISLSATLVNGMQEITYEDCAINLSGAIECKTTWERNPKLVPKNDRATLQDYLTYLTDEYIKTYLKQIKQLNGKVFYSMNREEVVNGYGESGHISHAILTKDCKLGIGHNNLFNVIFGSNSPQVLQPEVIIIGKSCEAKAEDRFIAYITDDGFIKVLSSVEVDDSGNYIILSEQKLFDRTSEATPYRLLFTKDVDLVTIDTNYKVIGSYKNYKNLADYDFVLPDAYRLWDKSLDYYFFISDFNGMTVGVKNKTAPYNSDEKERWFNGQKFSEPYADERSGQMGYLVVTKDGKLQHITFERNPTMKPDWEASVTVSGNGPFKLDIDERQKLVLKNANGESYWTL